MVNTNKHLHHLSLGLPKKFSLLFRIPKTSQTKTPSEIRKSSEIPPGCHGELRFPPGLQRGAALLRCRARRPGPRHGGGRHGSGAAAPGGRARSGRWPSRRGAVSSWQNLRKHGENSENPGILQFSMENSGNFWFLQTFILPFTDV